jgi:hypothetical protein
MRPSTNAQQSIIHTCFQGGCDEWRSEWAGSLPAAKTKPWVMCRSGGSTGRNIPGLP